MSQAFTGSLTHLVVIEPTPASDGNRPIKSLWAEDRNYVRGSAADWAPVIGSALLTIENECNQNGWDGLGSRAVIDATINLVEEIADCLFTLLPRGTPAPDLIPESDGEICISWVIDHDRIFSVSVGDHGKINFAGQFGAEGATHGWQPTDTSSRRALEASLQEIVRQINRLFPWPAIRRAA